jgi:hypothetical protein
VRQQKNARQLKHPPGIRPCIEVREDYSLRPVGTCGSKAITSSSRLAAALIILGGGRCIEAMRTHGLSKSFVVTNLMKVVDAINSCPQLAITCDVSAAACSRLAAEFNGGYQN